MLLISACLLGENCRYDGNNCFNKKLLKLMQKNNYEYKLICPEVDSGLSIPRSPAEIVGRDGFDVLKGQGLVKDKEDRDVTKFFIKGSRNIFKKYDKEKVKAAVLKSKSPSCGKKKIYSGKFDGKLKQGSGVAAAFLQLQGIAIFSEDELSLLNQFLDKRFFK